MDVLCADDMEHYRKLSRGERLRQALAMMREGFAMQRANLRRRHPDASEEEIKQLYQDPLSESSGLRSQSE